VISHFASIRTFSLGIIHLGVIYSVDLPLVCFQLGKVLRAKKVLNDKAQPAPNCVNFSSYEQLVWGDIPELIESVKQGSVAQAYAVHVMSQHLGHDHVDGGVRFIFHPITLVAVICLL
jgi:hypothetical protein